MIGRAKSEVTAIVLELSLVEARILIREIGQIKRPPEIFDAVVEQIVYNLPENQE